MLSWGDWLKLSCFLPNYRLAPALENSCNSRTNQTVGVGEVEDLEHVFAIRMRIFSTGERTYFVNRTFVVLLKKKTR